MKSGISFDGSATSLLDGSIALRLDGSQSKIVDGSTSSETLATKDWRWGR